ncbi:hypothetical protein GQ607_017174 [Colletotrichum asianum]|uniref:Uncharacterized protein n=1 Tax=Colletotrichum asianum TaxID=702518 RepID=A0A8H3VSD0_9PEZI|nr:hypothetical protein GQ607_017174 [Colletotrichum asianum]
MTFKNHHTELSIYSTMLSLQHDLQLPQSRSSIIAQTSHTCPTPKSPQAVSHNRALHPVGRRQTAQNRAHLPSLPPVSSIAADNLHPPFHPRTPTAPRLLPEAGAFPGITLPPVPSLNSKKAMTSVRRDD